MPPLASQPFLYRPTPGGQLLRELSGDPIGLLDRLNGRSAPVVRAGGSMLPVWIVMDSEGARTVLQHENEDFVRPPHVNSIFKTVSGRNVFTLAGQEWASRRKLIWPALSQRNISRILLESTTYLDDVVRSVKPNTELSTQSFCSDLTMATIANLLFGSDFPKKLPVRGLEDTSFVAEWMMHRFSNPMAPPAVLPTSLNRRFGRARRNLRKTLRSTVQARLDGSDTRENLLSLLMEAVHEDSGKKLSTNEIVDECMGLMFTGYETTGSASAWMLHYLAERPELQEKLRAEVHDACGDSAPSLSELMSLPLASAVVSEVLRLRPTAWATARITRRPVQVGDVRIPRWNFVLVALYAAHRNPESWSAPERFDPNRFLAAGNNADYLPFGVGPRRCLGDRLALSTMTSFMLAILRNWKLEPGEFAEPEPDTKFAMQLNPEHSVRFLPLG